MTIGAPYQGRSSWPTIATLLQGIQGAGQPPAAPPPAQPAAPQEPAVSDVFTPSSYQSGQGQGQAPTMRQPDTFANNALIASALAAQNPGADQIQQAQNTSSASMARLSGATPPPADAHPATSMDVWVTVPVDKVSVAKGSGTITPTYAAGSGYQQSGQGQAIPPTVAVGRTSR